MYEDEWTMNYKNIFEIWNKTKKKSEKITITIKGLSND